MLVRLRDHATVAGPDVVRRPDGSYELPDDQAQALLAAGHADSVDAEDLDAEDLDHDGEVGAEGEGPAPAVVKKTRKKKE